MRRSTIFRRSAMLPLGIRVLGACALGLGPALPASAQMGNGSPVQPAPSATAPRQDAPALPGLAARPRLAPIPAEPGQNLGPQEALFDAIDRGDLAAARDAVARGADLNARNALGLTALESSVDQGRSDITFFLLSNRPMVIGAPPPAPIGAAPNALLSAPSPQAVRRPAPSPAPRAASVVPLAVSRPAGGGVPQPDKGFLGFDAGRPGGG